MYRTEIFTPDKETKIQTMSEMTQADKMQLRLLAILDQSRVAWGDQANSINTVANQYRILKQQVSNLARVLGTLLMPIVQKVLPVINGLVISLQKLFIWVGNLIGIDWGKTMDGISKGYSGGTDGIDDFTDGTDEATQSMNNAAAAAKKLKNTILGFDEINALNDNSDVSSGSSSSAKNGGGDRVGVNIWCDVGDYLALSCRDANDSSKNNPVIKIDENTYKEHTPYIRNTANGTLFPDNPNGGITVENGLIKNWNLAWYNGEIKLAGAEGYMDVKLTIKNGLIVKAEDI